MDMIMDMPIELQAFETSIFIDDCLGFPAFEAINTSGQKVGETAAKPNIFKRIIDAIVKFFSWIKTSVVEGFKKFTAKIKSKKNQNTSEEGNDANTSGQQQYLLEDKNSSDNKSQPSTDKSESNNQKSAQSQQKNTQGTKNDMPLPKALAPQKTDPIFTKLASKYIDADNKLIETMRRIVILAKANVTQLNLIWSENLTAIAGYGKDMAKIAKTADVAFDKMQQINKVSAIDKLINEDLAVAKSNVSKARDHFQAFRTHSNSTYDVNDNMISMIKQLVTMMMKLCDDTIVTCNNIKSRLENNKGYAKTACDDIMSKAYNQFYLCAKIASDVQKIHQTMVFDVEKFVL